MSASHALPSVIGLILAGGLSRRMQGRDKAFLPFAGEMLLTRTLRRFANQVDSVLLSINGDSTRFASFGVPWVVDRRGGWVGPLAGVEAALLATEADWIVSVPVDLPFLPLDLVRRLSDSVTMPPVPTVAACSGRIHPVVCLWPRSALSAIQSALDADRRRLMDWFAIHPHHVVEFAVDAVVGVDPFFNVNHPEALVEAVQLARQDL